MTQQRMFLFLSAVCFFFALTGNPQTKAKTQAATDPHSVPFAVCQGTFALCTKAVCEPVILENPGGGKTVGFSCGCEVKTGYSAGANVPEKDPCKSVPTAPPSVGQKVPSRYSPIKGYVACNNKRPWAWCLDAPCVVDHVDKKDPKDPKKNTATCACWIATGAPYVYGPPDDQYSQRGCDAEYISSATPEDLFQITEFLTTPAGKNLPPVLPTLWTPPPEPTPTPSPTLTPTPTAAPKQ